MFNVFHVSSCPCSIGECSRIFLLSGFPDKLSGYIASLKHRWFFVPGCQITLSKEMEGMVLTLPKATRNFYVDGHKPEPHWHHLVVWSRSHPHTPLIIVSPSHSDCNTTGEWSWNARRAWIQEHTQGLDPGMLSGAGSWNAPTNWLLEQSAVFRFLEQNRRERMGHLKWASICDGPWPRVIMAYSWATSCKLTCHHV